MCIHKINCLTDQLGQTLEPLEFIDQSQDSCDYIELTGNDSWYSSKNDLLTLQLNIRGLVNKQEDLLKLINMIAGRQKLDVIMLQETWITQSNYVLVKLPGYKHNFMNRVGRMGGLVSVFVSKEISSRKLNNLCLNENHFECCMVELQLLNRKMYVGSIYRPPNTNINKFNFKFKWLVKEISKTNADYILGMDHDLNFLKSQRHSKTQEFLENILMSEMIPCIMRPTHITQNSATLIDNILISRKIYAEAKCGILLSDISDHFPCIMTWPNVLRSKSDSIIIN